MEETIPDIELKLNDYKTFIKKSQKLHASIEIDANGNWMSVNEKGDILATLKVPSYRKATKDEIVQMEEERLESIKEAEKDYEIAIEQSRAIYGEYKRGKVDANAVFEANNAVEVANVELSMKIYKIFISQPESSIEVRRILFDRIKDDHKMPHTIYRFRTTAFKLDDYVRLGQENELDIHSNNDENENENNKFINNKKGIVLFRYSSEDDVHGYLHPDYGVEIIYNETRYWTIEQVIAAEKARIYSNDDIRKKIMNTRSTSEMIKLAKGLQNPSKDLEWVKLYPEILNKATINKFEQNKDIRNKLLSTGNAVLGNASKDKMNGIGFRVDKQEALDMSKWSGNNLYGKAVMAARVKLKSTDGGTLKGSEDINESVISEDAYNNRIKQARMWSIINNRRKMGNHGGNHGAY